MLQGGEPNSEPTQYSSLDIDTGVANWQAEPAGPPASAAAFLGSVGTAQRLLAGGDEPRILEILGDLQGLTIHACGILVIAALVGDVAGVIEGVPVPVVEGYRGDDAEYDDDGEHDEGPEPSTIHRPALTPTLAPGFALAWRFSPGFGSHRQSSTAAPGSYPGQSLIGRFG